MSEKQDMNNETYAANYKQARSGGTLTDVANAPRLLVSEIFTNGQSSKGYYAGMADRDRYGRYASKNSKSSSNSTYEGGDGRFGISFLGYCLGSVAYIVVAKLFLFIYYSHLAGSIEIWHLLFLIPIALVLAGLTLFFSRP